MNAIFTGKDLSHFTESILPSRYGYKELSTLRKLMKMVIIFFTVENAPDTFIYKTRLWLPLYLLMIPQRAVSLLKKNYQIPIAGIIIIFIGNRTQSAIRLCVSISLIWIVLNCAIVKVFVLWHDRLLFIKIIYSALVVSKKTHQVLGALNLLIYKTLRHIWKMAKIRCNPK
jgi:hypothetical protein